MDGECPLMSAGKARCIQFKHFGAKPAGALDPILGYKCSGKMHGEVPQLRTQEGGRQNQLLISYHVRNSNIIHQLRSSVSTKLRPINMCWESTGRAVALMREIKESSRSLLMYLTEICFNPSVRK